MRQSSKGQPVKTADFDYKLPAELIAQHPASRRDASRMMVLHRGEGRWEHRAFTDLPGYLAAGDLLVLNNTRVVPARAYARKKTGGKVELLFLEEIAPGEWDVLLRARRRPRPGDSVALGAEAVVTLLEDGEMGRARVRVSAQRPIEEILEEAGEMPLPPYIQRSEDRDQKSEDRERYQTIYARERGAVAAPTAGLHFTPEMFTRLEALGVQRAEVTLHVGLGTFRPVSAEQVEDHRMEGERYSIPAATAERIAATRARGGRVVAVGSTTVRTLETAAARGGEVVAECGRSELFIHPPYEFRVVNAMLTNFHLPKSTLLMMVSALAGRELMLRAYEEAIREKYRFFSYGDCMLIL
jgi:S-adenosylmethionine:tRNA ribosyltransferase-isomerase